MNDVFVFIDPAEGLLRRYVAAGGLIATHEAVTDDPGALTPAMVEQFRRQPPEQFRLHQPPYSPPPPTSGSPVAARVAA